MWRAMEYTNTGHQAADGWRLGRHNTDGGLVWIRRDGTRYDYRAVTDAERAAYHAAAGK